MKTLICAFVFLLGSPLALGNTWLKSADSNSKVEKFLADIESQVPAEMWRVLGRVKVDFSAKFSRQNLATSDIDFGHLGRRDVLVARKRVVLSSQIKQIIEVGGTNFQIMTAKKALLYQLARLYDLSDLNWDNRRDRRAIFSCEIQFPIEKGQRRGAITPVCNYYLNARNKISDSLNYRSLSDFKGQRQVSKNDFVGRVENVTELDSVQSHFALNLSSFLLDTSYACRKPALYQFFSELTQSQPFAGACDKVTTLYSSSGGWKFNVNPTRVYQVHFLFASKGEEMMSRWGHSMLRLVVCAPDRTTVGPECLEDVAYHIVLSYRANVDDVIVNYWDGLSGKYPSQLMVFPLSQIVDEYTRGQWRDLISLPLKLNSSQKSILVQSAAEHYWSYSGSYKFITNNCATEADQLVRAALPKDHPYQSSSAMTPLGMYQNLSTFKLTDKSLIQDREKAKGQGYLFPSLKESLDKSFVKIKKYFSGYKDISELVLGSSAAERREVYKKFEALEDIGAGYIVEKYIQLSNERILQNLVSNSLQSDTSASDQELRVVIDKLLESSQGRLPWQYTSSGYGIPLAHEVVPDEEVAKRYREGSQWGAQYRDVLLQRFPEMSQELNEIKSNMKLLANLRRF